MALLAEAAVTVPRLAGLLMQAVKVITVALAAAAVSITRQVEAAAILRLVAMAEATQPTAALAALVTMYLRLSAVQHYSRAVAAVAVLGLAVVLAAQAVRQLAA